jgi:hypothetical protein
MTKKQMIEKYENYLEELFVSIRPIVTESDITPFYKEIASDILEEFIKKIAEELPSIKRKHTKIKLKKVRGALSQGDIETAREFPIDVLIESKTGKRFKSGYTNCFLGVHEDKTPSMKHNKNTNTVHCFGCHAHMSVIDVEMKLSNCDFKQAVKNILKT